MSLDGPQLRGRWKLRVVEDAEHGVSEVPQVREVMLEPTQEWIGHAASPPSQSAPASVHVPSMVTLKKARMSPIRLATVTFELPANRSPTGCNPAAVTMSDPESPALLNPPPRMTI